MEKGKEKEEKEEPGAFTSEEGSQVGRRHEAQRKHIHVDDARRSGWMDISKASQRQSECQKRFFRQRRQKDTQAQKKDKIKGPVCLAGKIPWLRCNSNNLQDAP